MQFYNVLQCSLLPAVPFPTMQFYNECSTMQFDACRPAQPFLYTSMLKNLQCSFCLPEGKAICLNRNNESSTMLFTACRPAQPFI
jgi:hypothetical protein